ncbi:MAG: hypothetical protein KDJ80_14100 [Nitratireductor sp.]|nr:hypothetical protein [Nitratireductor sp.]
MEELAQLTLEEQILREKQLVAECHLLDAWQAGLEDGIEPEILARALVIKALDQYARVRGYQAAARLTREIGGMEGTAEFLSGETLQ